MGLDTLTRLICESSTLNYDPSKSAATEHFREVSRRTQCIYAVKSSTWGGCDWNEALSLEDNIWRSCPALRCWVPLASRGEVDIFILEVVGKHYFSSLAEFGHTVRRTLEVVSDDDPKGCHAMRSHNAGWTDNGWIMTYGGLPMFVLPFCPLYAVSHSRHMFGTNSTSCFILLTSGGTFEHVGEFNLSDEDISTVQSMRGLSDRDRIRVAYHRAGRPFNLAHANCVVRPLDDFADEEPHWWAQHDARRDVASVSPGSLRPVLEGPTHFFCVAERCDWKVNMLLMLVCSLSFARCVVFCRLHQTSVLLHQLERRGFEAESSVTGEIDANISSIGLLGVCEGAVACMAPQLCIHLDIPRVSEYLERSRNIASDAVVISLLVPSEAVLARAIELGIGCSMKEMHLEDFGDSLFG